MTQRAVSLLLGSCCLALAGYLVLVSLLVGTTDASDWEKATRTYVEEYHRWLAESPDSGWARAEALAAGPERDRVERLRRELRGRSGWRYVDGEYRLLLQVNGKALVEASYRLEGGGQRREVHETFLLEKALQGLKVIKVMGGGQQ